MIPGLCTLLFKPGTVGGYSVTVAPASVGANDTAGTLTTDSVTASPVGGVAPYTYLWMRQSGDSAITINSPTSATTSFSRTMGPNEYTTATYLCRVTDNSSTVANSLTITVSFHTTGS